MFCISWHIYAYNLHLFTYICIFSVHILTCNCIFLHISALLLHIPSDPFLLARFLAILVPIQQELQQQVRVNSSLPVNCLYYRTSGEPAAHQNSCMILLTPTALVTSEAGSAGLLRARHIQAMELLQATGPRPAGNSRNWRNGNGNLSCKLQYSRQFWKSLMQSTGMYLVQSGKPAGPNRTKRRYVLSNFDLL